MLLFPDSLIFCNWLIVCFGHWILSRTFSCLKNQVVLVKNEVCDMLFLVIVLLLSFVAAVNVFRVLFVQFTPDTDYCFLCFGPLIQKGPWPVHSHKKHDWWSVFVTVNFILFPFIDALFYLLYIHIAETINLLNCCQKGTAAGFWEIWSDVVGKF